MAWYEVAVTVICSILASNGLWSVIASRNKKKSNETKLLMGIAYSKIIQQAEAYITRGYITTDEYHELYHYLYEPYTAEGGNGTAKRMMELVARLPASLPEKEENHEQ